MSNIKSKYDEINITIYDKEKQIGQRHGDKQCSLTETIIDTEIFFFVHRDSNWEPRPT